MATVAKNANANTNANTNANANANANAILKQEIINFFKRTNTQLIFDNYHDDKFKFVETYDEFVANTITQINSLNTSELKFLSKLSDFIEKKKINMIDEEDFVEHPAITFYYNNNSKLIIIYDDN